jgi:hypothetical protein
VKNVRKSKNLTGLMAFLILLTFMLTACQQLFSTSLMSGLASTTVTLPTGLDSAGAQQLAQDAKDSGDAGLATALLGELDGLIAGATDPAEIAALEGAAVDCAITASGVTDVLTGIIGTLSTGTPPTDAEINALLGGVTTTTDILDAFAYLNNPAVEATGEDYMLAAIAIIANEAAGNVSNLPTDIADWNTNADLQQALDFIQAGVDAFTASNYSPEMIAMITGLNGVVPAP